MSTQTEDKIINHILEMSEKDVKSNFAELLLNYYRIGRNDYTKEKCMNDYENIFKKVVLRDMFK